MQYLEILLVSGWSAVARSEPQQIDEHTIVPGVGGGGEIGHSHAVNIKKASVASSGQQLHGQQWSTRSKP
jgi:hypothetical protein